MRSLVAIAVLGICGSAVAAGLSPVDAMRTAFPRAVEMELALSGAPAHLRTGATVYAYGASGFEKVRIGTNGITCLLNRDAYMYGAKQFKPTCWDAVGATTFLPVMLKVGELLASGQAADAIRAAIDEGFAAGDFKAPTTGGIAYMLAGDLELDLATGRVMRQAFPGHYMFYAIGSTTAQLGVTGAALTENPSLPFVFAEGAGGDHGLAYIIVAPSGLHAGPHAHAGQ